MKRLLIGVAALLNVLAVASIAHGYYYPDYGWLYYDGDLYAESYFRWNYIPGSWETPDPGYEHDFGIQPQYINACASSTTMPYGYDDCPTAGWSEAGSMWFLSFGTYHATQLQRYTYYYGNWRFARPAGAWTSSEYSLYGNETWHDPNLCLYDNPWCMGGRNWFPLLSRPRWLNKGYSFSVFWNIP